MKVLIDGHLVKLNHIMEIYENIIINLTLIIVTILLLTLMVVGIDYFSSDIKIDFLRLGHNPILILIIPLGLTFFPIISLLLIIRNYDHAINNNKLKLMIYTMIISIVIIFLSLLFLLITNDLIGVN